MSRKVVAVSVRRDSTVSAKHTDGDSREIFSLSLSVKIAQMKSELPLDQDESFSWKNYAFVVESSVASEVTVQRNRKDQKKSQSCAIAIKLVTKSLTLEPPTVIRDRDKPENATKTFSLCPINQPRWLET